MTDDSLIKILRARATDAATRSDGALNLHPVATITAIREAERELDLGFPKLLQRVYLEVGNGGWMLGPGFGMLGLPGGYNNDSDWNVVKTTNEMAWTYPWWDGAIVICDWGCGMISCIDCSDDDFPVYRFDGNFVEDPSDDGNPPDHAWYLEADSLAEWLLIPNSNSAAT